MVKLVLGLAGRIGAGKDTVSNYLKQKGFLVLAIGDMVRAEAARRGLEPTRENLLRLTPDILKLPRDTDHWIKTLDGKIIVENPDLAAINGIRRKVEVENPKRDFGN